MSSRYQGNYEPWEAESKTEGTAFRKAVPLTRARLVPRTRYIGRSMAMDAEVWTSLVGQERGKERCDMESKNEVQRLQLQ